MANPDGIVVEKNMVSSPDQSGIIYRTYKIPEIVKFLYGKPVQGHAYALFGIIMDKEKKSIADSLHKVPIQDGKGCATLTGAVLRRRFPKPDQLLGHSIYVTVTVLTDTGSDMVEAEKSGIRIVSSPYEIFFTRSSSYFKPGMPYSLMVSVVNPDGTPAPQVPVRSGPSTGPRGLTQDDGTIQLVLNTPLEASQLWVKVQTEVVGRPKARQSFAVWSMDAYRTQGDSGNYLHISVSATVLKPEDTLTVNFNLRNSNDGVKDQIQYFTYLVLNKGKIIQAGRQDRQAGQDVVVMSLPITPDLLPSFRLVAYYHVGQKEVVADSVWVDIKDTCMGTIWDTVEKNDIGCTPGGGRDNVGVFADAGLVLQTNAGIETRRRAARAYQRQHLRKCCEDGMQDNPMGYSCDRRAKYIVEGSDCIQAFLDCCHHIFTTPSGRLHAEHHVMHHLMLFMSKEILVSSHRPVVEEEEEEGYLLDEDVVTRSHFSESWLWQTELLPLEADHNGLASSTVPLYLEDSITTWEVLAVSLSGSKGLCVADPYEILVMKDVFIDLRLPYSVVRNEQVAIRAVLYNYTPMHLQVGRPSGEQVETVGPVDMKNVVPNTEPVTLISVRGDLVGDTLENTIDGANLKHLIQVPAGCGEQNMIGMTPAVIATHYLDHTRQWGRVGADRRAEAIQAIAQGYAQQLAYCKADHSYAAFPSRPSSTWLTAYVVKVFAMAVDLIAISPEVLCEAVKWLIMKKQDPSRIFQETAPVIHGAMAGGYRGSETNTSLTAFVVIAMVEARHVCEQYVQSLGSSIKKAGDYLVQQLSSLKKPYSIAITAYALALLGQAGARDKLMALSTGGTHWPDPRSRLYSIESTSYALLALLKEKQLEQAGPIVQWLAGQRYYGGGYGSTQVFNMTVGPGTGPPGAEPLAVCVLGATILVFQALAQYQVDISMTKDMDLDVSINMRGRSKPILWRINTDNALVSRTEQTRLTNGFTVVAKGHGKGTLSVMTVYYAPLAEETTTCKHFNFSVVVQSAPDAKKPNGALGLVSIEICMRCLFLVSGRMSSAIIQTRSTTAGKPLPSLCFLSSRFLGEADSAMTLLDISMLTGFSPDMDDLNKLTQRVDKYISRFEWDTHLSDRGSLILYLDKVSSKETECLTFKAYQYFEVGLIQPAAVTVKSLHQVLPPNQSPRPAENPVPGHVCRCMEEKCSLIKTFKEPPTNISVRVEAACEPGVDYVYRAQVVQAEQSGMYRYFTMRIVQVIKEGTEQGIQGKMRRFISPLACEETLNLQENKDYLIWGLSSDLWDLKTEMTYLLRSSSWIELWPSPLECQQGQLHLLCQGLQDFAQHLLTNGCPT
ncbi:venom factor-like [Alligator mississippiensis]|uniref:venom factor-like n=1 Tax=Alligator mississippiensis TaxID=8496 RepID=UPI002877718A|nr:venom factor-like [Alligator mississippiensis]